VNRGDLQGGEILVGVRAAIVCAGQRIDQEGSSPSGSRMRGVISKGGGNASLAEMIVSEGRVSTARWNLKGLRRSAGP